MKVFGLSNDPQPWTNPFPAEDTNDGIPGVDGFIWALRGGDVLSPDSWSKPTRVQRRYFWLPVRWFFAFRKGRYGGYIGNGKVFGADGEQLKAFPSVNPAEVYPGSIAMQGFTWRFTNKLGVAGA